MTDGEVVGSRNAKFMAFANAGIPECEEFHQRNAGFFTGIPKFPNNRNPCHKFRKEMALSSLLFPLSSCNDQIDLSFSKH